MNKLKLAGEEMRQFGDCEKLIGKISALSGVNEELRFNACLEYLVPFKHLIHFNGTKMRFGPGFRRPEDFYNFCFSTDQCGDDTSYAIAFLMLRNDIRCFSNIDCVFRLTTIIESLPMRLVLESLNAGTARDRPDRPLAVPGRHRGLSVWHLAAPAALAALAALATTAVVYLVSDRICTCHC